MLSFALLGQSSENWTAIGTVALALATLGLIAVTWRVSKKAESSASASAEAAKESAQAVRGLNDLLLAQTKVDFSIKYLLWRSGSIGRLGLTCRASSVFFHELLFLSGTGPPAAGIDLADAGRESTKEEMDAVSRGEEPRVLCPPEPNDFPLRLPKLMHKDETVWLLYPGFPLEPGSPMKLRIVYSLSEDGPTRSIDRAVTEASEM